MNCPNCHKVIDDASLFCMYCGHKLPSANSSISPKIFTVNGVTFTMIPVAGGTFTMGATPEQGSDAEDYGISAHQVSISDFYIGESVVTQELWLAVMGSNPSVHEGINLPVENVSWEDCQEFISNLRSITREKFRLPTEAEWEYAARGGSSSIGYKYSGSNNPSLVAWYIDNSGDEIHQVKQNLPNELGIYDMSGNVWEWCQDFLEGNSSAIHPPKSYSSKESVHIFRGGSYFTSDIDCRVSSRCDSSLSSYRCDLGLRLAL